MNTPVDPLRTPEVRQALALGLHHFRPTLTDEECREEADALLLAVQSAVLSAERTRLLAMTPEEVVEAATRAVMNVWCDSDGIPDTGHVEFVRAAAPILLAPEIQRREQAERVEREKWAVYFHARATKSLANAKKVADPSHWLDVAAGEMACVDMLRSGKTPEECLALLEGGPTDA